MALPWRRDARGRKGRLARAERRAAGIFLLPYGIGFAIFILFPLAVSAALVFMKYDVLTPARFVGLANLKGMLGNPRFWHVWELTAVYGVGGVVLTLLLGFCVAMGLYHVKRGTGLWRTLYYLPALIVGTGEAMMEGMVWSRDGLVNYVLALVGIQGPGWLQDAHWAMPALILMRYWTIGNVVLFFLASRAGIPEQLYEAARLDGAGAWRTLRHVTLPLMTPIILFNVIVGVITTLQSFTQVYLLTRGGPAGSTEIIGIHLYFQAFQNLEMGYAAAVSWSLFVVTMALSVILLITSKRWVYYELDEGW